LCYSLATLVTLKEHGNSMTTLTLPHAECVCLWVPHYFSLLLLIMKRGNLGENTLDLVSAV
jgi:hypothetical protein